MPTREVVATAHGGPEVLRLVEATPRPPGPGEVQLQVHAAGVNPWDWKSYAPGAVGTPPVRLGLEVSGVVRAVGTGVARPGVGDEVVAWPVTGGYRDVLTVPADVVVRRPHGLDAVRAAGLLAAGAAAVHAVTATGVGEGDVVLVHAAAGGVGRAVVQLARLRGARVVATASPAGHAALRALGACPVGYGPGLVDRVRAVQAGLGRVTVAVDAAGTDEALETSVALVADRRRVATLVALDRAATFGVLALGHGPGADPGDAVRSAARHHLVALAADGALDVHVAATYPLEEAAAAHRQGMAGHSGGKLVLVTR